MWLENSDLFVASGPALYWTADPCPHVVCRSESKFLTSVGVFLSTRISISLCLPLLQCHRALKLEFISGRITPPQFFFFKNILAVLDPLLFYVHFRISLNPWKSFMIPLILQSLLRDFTSLLSWDFSSGNLEYTGFFVLIF